MTFADLRPGDVFFFAHAGAAIANTPRYLCVEGGLAYKWHPEGIEGDTPRRIAAEVEVVRIAHFSLAIGRDLGQVPPALPPGARAVNE